MANKNVKNHVIAFRLSPAESKKVIAALAECEIIGTHSTGQLARKLVLDFALDKLSWATLQDKQLSPDISSALIKS